MIEVKTSDLKINDLTHKALYIIKTLKVPISDNVSIYNDIDYINVFDRKMPTDTLGCCITKNFCDTDYSIYIRSDISEKNTLETILHEFIHTCDKCFNHGALFKKYSDKINEYVLSHYEYTNFSCGFGDQLIDESSYIKNTYKYVIVCPHCNSKTYFTKKCKTVKDISMAFKLSIRSNYQCQKCGCTRLIPKDI